MQTVGIRPDRCTERVFQGWQTTCIEDSTILMPAKSVGHLPVSKDAHEIVVRPAVGQPERRRRVRTRLHWQVDLLVLSETGVIETATRDLNSNGFYCCSPVPFVPGERMLCILKVPAYNPEQVDSILPLECQVRIVRVDPVNGDGFYGLGCEINDYRFLHI